MEEFHTIGSPPIKVVLKRTKRARRISLRISNVDGTVSLTMPMRTPTREGLNFALSKEVWLRKHLETRPEPTEIGFGRHIWFRGQSLEICQGQGRLVQTTQSTILIPGAEHTVTAKLRGFLKEQARRELTFASEKYAKLTDRPFGKITLRDTRSRWGSCTSAGNLMYSWRLIMAPPEVLDYVAAHEVCHLQEMNHSAAYWAAVQRVCPNYNTYRGWLKQHGSKLHQFQL